MDAYSDLFMMKNMARVLVTEGYNGGRTHAPGLVIHVSLLQPWPISLVSMRAGLERLVCWTTLDTDSLHKIDQQ
jgi:hypothetical protein